MTVQDVLTYIEKNLEDDISIDDIVKISGYGRRYIQYIFKYYVKMPIGMYIRKRRIARSSILLRLTKMSVIEISVKLSFDSQQSFCREFKKTTGYTPLQYRKSLHWDLTPLKSTFQFTPLFSTDMPRLCTLPAGKITGDEYHFDVPLLEDSCWQHSRWLAITRYLARDGADLWVLNDYVTNEKCLQRLKVFNAMGRAGDNPACRDLHFRYPGGLYAHFQFDCTRDEYPAYSAFIYQHVLASYGFKRRDGYDIEIFSVLDLAKGILHCEYYIPVAL